MTTIMFKELMQYILEVCLLITIVSIVLMTWYHIEITEPMKSLAVMIASAFFSNKIPWGLQSNKNSDGA